MGMCYRLSPLLSSILRPNTDIVGGEKTLAGPSVGSQDRDWKTIDIESVLDFKNVDLSIIILYVPIDRTMYLDGAPPTYSINVLVQYMCYG